MASRTDATRRKLYDAAIELIGHGGYEDTSVDDIVEKAGTAKGTVYYHFTGKAELVEAMLRDRTDALIERFHAIEEATVDDPQTGILELVRAQIEFLTEQEAFTKLLIAELWRTDRPWHPVLNAARNELVSTICREVRRGVEKGVFRTDVDPDFGGYALFGTTTFVALDAMTHHPDQDSDELIDQITRLAWSALRIC